MFLDKKLIVFLLFESLLYPFLHESRVFTFIGLVFTYALLYTIYMVVNKLYELARKVYIDRK